MPYWTLDILIELDPPYVTECNRNKLSIGMMEINLQLDLEKIDSVIFSMHIKH